MRCCPDPNMEPKAATSIGAVSQLLAEPPCPSPPLDLGISRNHLKNMERYNLARDVLKVVHPRRVIRPLRRQEPEMQTFPRNPLTREDTLLGVCEALGEDFRFNPLLLRVALGAGL